MRKAVELPEMIGAYEILGIAGRGAMGVVYHGYDPFFDRDVAIKTIQTPRTASLEHAVARKMLMTEVTAAKNLEHGTIIQVFDVGELNDEPYVVMEYVANAITLQDHCNVDNLLPLDQVLPMIYNCALALDYAHQKGVIHCDIKASNILVTTTGESKISDFGIATIETEEVTAILGTVGSPRYMSPEQFLDSQITARTDLYSLGVLLYELLTGHTAFQSRTFASLMREILTAMPTPAHELNASVSRELSDLVTHAMNKSPEDRFQSGLEFAAALSALVPELDHSSAAVDRAVKFRLTRELNFFQDFLDPELREFIEACTWRHVKPNARIIREGNMDRSCYIVVSGEVAINKSEQRIGTLGRGSCFGEMGFLSRSGRSATVRARGEVTILVAQWDLVSILSPAVRSKFNDRVVNILVERLASTTDRLSKFLTEAAKSEIC